MASVMRQGKVLLEIVDSHLRGWQERQGGQPTRVFCFLQRCGHPPRPLPASAHLRINYSPFREPGHETQALAGCTHAICARKPQGGNNAGTVTLFAFANACLPENRRTDNLIHFFPPGAMHAHPVRVITCSRSASWVAPRTGRSLPDDCYSNYGVATLRKASI